MVVFGNNVFNAGINLLVLSLKIITVARLFDDLNNQVAFYEEFQFVPVRVSRAPFFTTWLSNKKDRARRKSIPMRSILMILNHVVEV